MSLLPDYSGTPPLLRTCGTAGGRIAVGQLYSALRSAANWGIGDFGDLRQMIAETARRRVCRLNPLHALFPAAPESASPYSPSSRRWLNILYIDVGAGRFWPQRRGAGLVAS